MTGQGIETLRAEYRERGCRNTAERRAKGCVQVRQPCQSHGVPWT